MTDTKLSEPDNFPLDWYGYATNQTGHFLLGLVAYIWLQACSFYVFGEFSYRWHVFLVIAVAYTCWEAAWRGKLADSVEDWLIVVGYGAGIPALTFVEYKAGTPLVVADFEMLLYGSLWVAAHISYGVVCRIMAIRNANS